MRSKYIITDKYSIKDALITLNKLSSDILTLFVINDLKTMIGTITDGDIRRGIINGYHLSDSIIMIMNKNFKYILEDNIDVHIVKEFKKNGFKLVPSLNKKGHILRIYNLKDKNSILPIDVVLMAGGKGKRLRPLTENVPKPLLKIGNKSIIDYNIDRLISFGIENIYVTVNYLKEQLEDNYKNKRNGIKINCVREPEFLGTIGSIKFVENFDNDTILIMNSDLFTDIDYQDFYLHFKENNASMSVASVLKTNSVPYGIFNVKGDDVLGIEEKPTYNHYVNAGIYLIKRSIIDLIPNYKFYNATDLILELIKLEMKVIKYPITGYWIDIGKHEEYSKAKYLARHIFK